MRLGYSPGPSLTHTLLCEPSRALARPWSPSRECGGHASPSSRLPPTVTPFMQRRPLPRTSPSGRPPPTEMPDCPAGCAPARLASGLRPQLLTVSGPPTWKPAGQSLALGTVHAPFSDTVLISLSSPSPGRGDSRHLPLDAPVWGLGSGEWGGLCSLLSAAGRHIRL